MWWQTSLPPLMSQSVTTHSAQDRYVNVSLLAVTSVFSLRNTDPVSEISWGLTEKQHQKNKKRVIFVFSMLHQTGFHLLLACHHHSLLAVNMSEEIPSTTSNLLLTEVQWFLRDYCWFVPVFTPQSVFSHCGSADAVKSESRSKLLHPCAHHFKTNTTSENLFFFLLSLSSQMLDFNHSGREGPSCSVNELLYCSGEVRQGCVRLRL